MAAKFGSTAKGTDVLVAADGEPGHTAGGGVVPEAATVPLVGVVPEETEPEPVPDDVPAVATTDPAVAVPELAPVAAATVPDETAPDDGVLVPVPPPVPVVAIVPDTAVDDPVLEDEPELEPLIATWVPLLEAHPW